MSGPAHFGVYLKPLINFHFFPDIDINFSLAPTYLLDYLAPPPINPFRGHNISCGCKKPGTSNLLYQSKSVSLPLTMEIEIFSLLKKTFTFYDPNWIIEDKCLVAPQICTNSTCRECNTPFVYSSENKFPEACPGAVSEKCYCYTRYPDNQPACAKRFKICRLLKACGEGSACPSGEVCIYKTGCQALPPPLGVKTPLCVPRCQ